MSNSVKRKRKNGASKIDGLMVAMVQMVIVNDPMQNAINYIAEVRKAVADGADVVIGSEMMLCQYFSSDRYEDVSFVNDVQQAIQHIISESAYIDAVLVFGGIGVDAAGMVNEDGRRRKYNAAFVVQHGKLVSNDAGLAFAIKTLLVDYRVYSDSRYFYDLNMLAYEMGCAVEDLLKPFTVKICGVEYKLGVMLCEDMWDIDYAIKPSLILKENGAEILINLSASNWSWRKDVKRDRVIADICRKTGLWFVYVNNVGCQNTGHNFLSFDGSSTVYSSGGNIVALTEPYKAVTKVVELGGEFVFSFTRPQLPDEAELYNAIVQATKGFLETVPDFAKQKVVIGNSGGIDSALSIAFFAKLLGPENVIAVNMPYSNFNADETKSDAAELCRRLGVKDYRIVPIDKIVDTTCALTGIKVGTSQHKTAQAVARMNVLSAIASQENGFFTCNANMSEIAFGYGTLNGDMRGTFAPWSSCLKQDVYRLADYLNREVYGREVIPQSIFKRPPMDELTMAGTGERGDPFFFGDVKQNGYHDQMVRAIVVFRHGPEWFLEQYMAGTLERELQLPVGTINSLFKDGKVWLDDLERCFGLYQDAVFKRQQLVPGPLVDRRAFGSDLRESILKMLWTMAYKHMKMMFGIKKYPSYQAV
ncbi:NAD(+) synthase [Candidatus Nomurabacteria bacterium]|nr:NAD(+) synthase [Candidatus Kaiserbacteria bacterium]MCB9814626.1 NAD(+) synthase [Candidatus Nomurabacteria bacterium]